MRWIIIVISLFLCSCTQEGRSISIASYNCYAFFDSRDDGYEYEGFRYSDGYNEIRYGKRIDSYSRFLSRYIDADIIILEEVENSLVLVDLLEAGLRKRGYRYYGIADDRPLAVGFISRIRPSSVTIHSPQSGRCILKLEFIVNGELLTVFALHAKSRIGGGGEERRAMMEYVHSLASLCEGTVIVAGDFNTDPESGEDALSKSPGSAFPVTGDQGQVSGSVYYALSLDWELDLGKGTYCYEGQWSFLDNILAGRSLFDGAGMELAYGCVIDPEEAKDTLSRPRAYSVRTGIGYSDHFAIKAVLEYK